LPEYKIMKNLGQARHLSLLAIAFVLLVPLSTSTMATEPAAGIVITLPADLSAEQRAVLVEALGQLEQPVRIDDPVAPSTESAGVSGLALALGRFDDAMLAAGQVPGLLAAWWVGLTGTGGLASLLALLAGAAAMAAGLGLEYLVDRLLAGWRRACLTTRTERFAKKLGFAIGWFGLEIVGLVVFGVGAILVGWLILPDTAVARLSLAVAVLGVIRVRLLLALGHLVFAPHTPNLRMIDMPDADAKLVWRWILVIGVVAAAAFGIRDVLAGAGATPDAVAFLGIAAASVVLVARLTAFIRAREPIRELIRRSYRRQDGSTPALARWLAATWHLLFAAVAVLAFFGELYAALTAGAGALASAALGPIVILALLPFVLGAYRALIDDLIVARTTDAKHAVIGDVLKSLGQGAFVLMAFVILAGAWGANPFAGADRAGGVRGGGCDPGRLGDLAGGEGAARALYARRRQRRAERGGHGQAGLADRHPGAGPAQLPVRHDPGDRGDDCARSARRQHRPAARRRRRARPRDRLRRPDPGQGCHHRVVLSARGCVP
jgi:hypothetical protein